MSKLNKTKSVVPSIGISYKTTLGAAVAAAVGVGPAIAQDSSGIEEITVTATKRGDTSLQDFAGSIQAFGTEALRNQNLFNLEDYSKFVPSMTYFGNQTGQGKIFFRGIADAPDTFIAAQSAAVYLDEQPITQGSAVDVRLVDIERVEALSGPQGTLYGSSSQSGTLRIVTNKPDPTKFEAFGDVTVKGMSEGASSYDISGMVNIPLADNKFAIRLVGFSATDGGFIDNVLGTTANNEWLGRSAVGGEQQLNTDAVEEDWNETTVTGGRVGAKWFINDRWSATLGLANQSVDSKADNSYDSTVGDLQIIAFNPDTFESDWTQYALTIEGEIGSLNFTSATAYFTHDSTYAQDTTTYAAYFGSFCYYWTATYNVYCFQPAGTSYAYSDPIGYLQNDAKNTSFTQEFRLSFSGERIDWVGGVFYEDRAEEWVFDTYVTNQGGYRASEGFDLWNRPHSTFERVVYYNGTDYTYTIADGWGVDAEPTDSWWFSADDTDWSTLAVFGEATFHITEALSVTGGARWFEVEQNKLYTVQNPSGRTTPGGLPMLADPDAAPGRRGCLVTEAPCSGPWSPDALFFDSDNPADVGINDASATDSDTAFKFSLQYSFSDDVMLYGLYSEGFRPGGTNRNRGLPKLPQAYGADFLENTEFGIRSQFADGRMQVNLTAFFQDWVDYQVEVVDPSHNPCSDDPTPPCGQPWQKGILNAGNASSDGVELAIEAVPTDGLTLRFNATWHKSEITDEIEDFDDVGKGSKLPFAPEFKGSFYAQYNWPTSIIGSEEMFLQFQYSHVGDSLNQVQEIPILDEDGNFTATPQLTMAAYDFMSLKYGLVGPTWEANLFVNNITDERGELYHDVTDFDTYFGRSRTAIIRPTEYGIRFVKFWN